MTTSAFDNLKKRSRLGFADRIPSIQDQIEWADLCLGEREHDSATMLYQMAFVRQGLSAQLRAEQASRATQAGLRQANLQRVAQCPDRAATAAGTIEVAIADLRKLAGLVAPQFVRGATSSAEPGAEFVPHIPTEAKQGGTVDSPSDIAGTIGQLYRLLSGPSFAAQAPEAEDMMRGLEAANAHVPGFDYRAFCGATLPVLAMAMAFAGLQDYIDRNRDLISPPFGSAIALNALARLDSFGLGPYLGNVQRLARKSQDIFELADIAVAAAREAGIDGPEAALWVVFLSREVRGPLLSEVIDTLGDGDERAALACFFHREAMKPRDRIDVSLLMRLRDAALDNLDYGLAGRAQRLIAELRFDLAHEWEILGSIEGSAGRISTAEQAFLRSLELQPDNEDVKKRLFAVRSRNFESWVVANGYGSPEDRRLNRLRRRHENAKRSSTNGSP